MNLLSTGDRSSAIYCVICIFRPVVVTGIWLVTLHSAKYWIKAPKLVKTKTSQLKVPVTTTCRKLQFCWKPERYAFKSPLSLRISLEVRLSMRSHTNPTSSASFCLHSIRNAHRTTAWTSSYTNNLDRRPNCSTGKTVVVLIWFWKSV